MKQPTPPRLGKGLSSIISPRASGLVESPPPRPAAAPDPAPLSIPMDKIHPNPRQPRAKFDPQRLEELAHSIRLHGVIQPVLLRKTALGAYELVAGERRWRAAQAAGLMAIPAVVRDVTDAESMEMALVENLQREDLGPLERARAYEQYIRTFQTPVESLARRLGESRANVSNYLRLLKLPTEVQTMLHSGELGMGQARALAGLDDPQRQVALARLIIRRNLSARQAEELAQAHESAGAPDESLERRAADRHFADVERALSRALGMTIRLSPGKKKNSGRIIIRYSSLEEFEQVARRLGAETTLD